MDKNNIKQSYYIFKLKEYLMHEIYKAKPKTYYIGCLVNNTNGNFYFELKDTNDLLIIPHEYIEWLFPYKDEKIINKIEQTLI